MTKITNYYVSTDHPVEGPLASDTVVEVGRLIDVLAPAEYIGAVAVWENRRNGKEAVAAITLEQAVGLRDALNRLIDEEGDWGQPPVYCGRSLKIGPAHDPYGTECDLPVGHAGAHEGQHPLIDDERVRWTGGGYAAGDPLPYKITEHLPSAERDQK